MSCKNAIISVFNKVNLEKLIPFLEKENYNIYSTGGTLQFISKIIFDKKKLFSLSEYTGYPEVCGGRVKTLHPKIYGGILSLPDNEHHQNDLSKINALNFELVIVNLYPFENFLLNNPNNEEVLLENIDIGGHTLLRAAAKNYKNITVLSNPSQYSNFIENIFCRKQLAMKAFKEAMNYDIAINNWFNRENGDCIGHSLDRISSLKYGLNPHMKPSDIYIKKGNHIPFQILNGQPGYINLLDVNYAIHLVLELKELLGIDCCASYKHNSPAGVAIKGEIYSQEKFIYEKNKLDESVASSLFIRTRNIDPKSSFGDIISYSGKVDKELADVLKLYVSDGIIAADYTESALDVLRKKKNGSYLILKQSLLIKEMEYRDLNGITLCQPTNDSILQRDNLGNLADSIKNDMILGFITLKYTQSNSVCFVCDGKVIGIGAGQQNRVDCIKIAGNKALDYLERNSINSYDSVIIMVSDAFLPFTDNITEASKYHVDYILQPGGSIRDKEIEESCKNLGIEMIYSNIRSFTH